MQIALDWIGRQVRNGRLEFVAPDGRRWSLGHGEPRASVRVRDAGVLLRILRNPTLAFPETYMDGDWEPEDGDLRKVIEAATQVAAALDGGRLAKITKSVGSRIGEWNTPLLARRNVSHHYDIDYALYSRFLDADLHYSCAYYPRDDMTLEQAQQAKCAHIANKLSLRPGMRVLDIGCGWGSLAMYLAEQHGVKVVGITLSKEQLAVAKQRTKERGLDRWVEFRLQDYRQTQDRFDAVVSVGMFEHVGRPQYASFFQHVFDRLSPDGVALLHTIGRSSEPGGTNAWVRKYIFPGGYCPAASEVLTALEPSKLILTDLEVLRLHYAKTLAAWHQRFQAARDFAKAQLGERFCRMWEFYLLSAEANFRWGELVVFQFQLTRDLLRLPLERSYLYSEQPENALVQARRRRGV